MSKDRPPTYEMPARDLLPVCGLSVFEVVWEVWAWDALGQVGAAAAGTLGSAKKVSENRAFFFRKFCKVNFFAYICIEKNTKLIQL